MVHDKYSEDVKRLIKTTLEPVEITIGDGKPNPTDEIRHININA